MLKNYITIAFRNLWRNKTFSFINIFGLSVGMAACILITMWVQSEISYDTFHEKSDRIFRVDRKGSWKEKDYHVPATGALYGQALVDEFPEVENSVRLFPQMSSVKDFRNIFHKDIILFTDNSFFEIFTFPIVSGDKVSSLREPNSVVLTEKMAEKYFNEKNPMGKLLSIEYGDKIINLKVNGIIKEFPDNSHMHFDILASLNTYEKLNTNKLFESWTSNFLYTYILLNDKADISVLSTKFKGFVKKYLSKPFEGFLGDIDITTIIHLHATPITDIHLKSNTGIEIENNGNLTMVYVFSIIALIILLTACINFMNLSTARAGKRAREVGLRKVSGARKFQLISQFLGESVFVSLLSMVIAISIVELLLPTFNYFTDKTLTWSSFFTGYNLAYLVCIALLTGLLSGIYPAFFISSYKTSRVLKGEATTTKGTLRKILVILQFAISIALIISAIVIFQQQKLFNEKSLGFDKQQMMVLNVESSEVSNNFKAFRNQLMMLPGVENVSTSNNIPSNTNFNSNAFYLKGTPQEDFSEFQNFHIDYNFIETYKMEIVAGRNFSKDFGSDVKGILLNETAVKELRLQKPEDIIGKFIMESNSQGKELEYKVVGVVKDFNYMSLHNKINPLILYISEKAVSYIYIRMKSNDINHLVGAVEKEWTSYFPGKQLNYSFMDERLNKFYKGEKKIQQIIFSFTIFGIFISCLGLFGLATFSAEQKKKEIGVRKVLGASVSGIVLLLSSEFTKWILVSNLIAWPVSYYFLNKWLDNFAYRISISWWVFVFAGVIALGIALITVCFQSVKSALDNPVNSLKYE